MTQEELFKKLIAHCKEYGFVFPSSEIYDGLAAVYDYGQNGVELKKTTSSATGGIRWSSCMRISWALTPRSSCTPVRGRLPGHVGAFNDPLIDNKDSKKRYRADVLIEDWLAKQDEKIEKEVEKARKRFGETFDEAKYRETSPRVAETAARRDEMHKRFVEAQNSGDLGELRQIIVDCEIVCPISGTRNWTEVRQFNLMFSTQMGSTAEGANTIYLRPETAQGIFVNFLNVQKTGRMKLPFGIAQIGKAFRNEIVARQFIFRMREFEQMEMQFFVRPGEEMKWWQAWKETRMAWHRALGFGDDRYRFHDHEKLAHYANAATDIEYNFPFGFKEVEGIHSRTDFDLGNHQKFSGRKIQYFDPETGESYVPYVVETSIGVDRMFLQVMSAALYRGAARRRRLARRAASACGAGPREGRRSAAGEEGRHARSGAEDRGPLEIRLQRRLRREGFRRQALPPSGRRRHAVLRDRGRSDARRQHRDGASPRHHAAGACCDRQAARAGRGGVLLPQAFPEAESVIADPWAASSP